MIGFFAQKMMMTSYVDESTVLPITILKTTQAFVLGCDERNGYYVFRLGFFTINPQHLCRYSKSFLNSYQQNSQQKYKLIREFKIFNNTNNACIIDKLMDKYKSKSYVHIQDIFTQGMTVKVKGVVKGRGFTGPMKRHNFDGMAASHGVSLAHRTHGSLGSCNPNNVYKGRKMAGRYGGTSACIFNLKIVKVDGEKGLLYVSGSIPGCRNSIVSVYVI